MWKPVYLDLVVKWGVPHVLSLALSQTAVFQRVRFSFFPNRRGQIRVKISFCNLVFPFTTPLFQVPFHSPFKKSLSNHEWSLSPYPQTVGKISVLVKSLWEMLIYVTLGRSGEWLFSVFCTVLTCTSSFYILGLYLGLLPAFPFGISCMHAFAAGTSVHAQCMQKLASDSWKQLHVLA